MEYFKAFSFFELPASIDRHWTGSARWFSVAQPPKSRDLISTNPYVPTVLPVWGMWMTHLWVIREIPLKSGTWESRRIQSSSPPFGAYCRPALTF